jgi:hypothetical protein
VNDVCVLSGAIDGGANDYFGYIVADNGAAADTFAIVSGSLPPGRRGWDESPLRPAEGP